MLQIHEPLQVALSCGKSLLRHFLGYVGSVIIVWWNLDSTGLVCDTHRLWDRGSNYITLLSLSFLFCETEKFKNRKHLILNTCWVLWIFKNRKIWIGAIVRWVGSLPRSVQPGFDLWHPRWYGTPGLPRMIHEFFWPHPKVLEAYPGLSSGIIPGNAWVNHMGYQHLSLGPLCATKVPNLLHSFSALTEKF